MTNATRVFKYWCEPADDESLDTLNEQIDLGNEYSRLLADLENFRRDEFRPLCREDAKYRESDDQVAALFAVSVDERDVTWDKQLEAASTARHDAYKCIRDRVLQASRDNTEVTREFSREARKTFGPRGRGLSFASYQFIEEAHAKSVKATAPYKKVVRHRESGCGVFAVALQNDYRMDAGRVMNGECDWIRVGNELYAVSRPLDRRTRVRDESRQIGRRLREVSLRVDNNRRIRLHVLFHYGKNKLPWVPASGALVQARVHVTRTGTKRRYSLQFVVTNLNVKSGEQRDGNIVGVDLGFRRIAEGYQIAVARDLNGHERRLVVPWSIAGRAIKEAEGPARSTTLKSTRAVNLNVVLNALRQFRDSAPAWFRTATNNVHAWRSPRRVVGLRRRWMSARWDGDAAMFDYVTSWCRQDAHLWDWEAHNRTRMTRQIRGLYERWARDLAKDYAVIKIENLEVRELQQLQRTKAKKNHAADPQKSKTAKIDERAMLRLATLGPELCRSCQVTGTGLGKVEKAGTSQHCTRCSARVKNDGERDLRCTKCSHVEDRDSRAAHNIANGEVLEWIAGPLAVVKCTKRKQPRRRTVTPSDVTSAGDQDRSNLAA